MNAFDSPYADTGTDGQEVLIRMIRDIQPLSSRAASLSDVPVPDGLEDIVFSPHRLPGDDRKVADGNTPANAVLQTFAILDAAKIKNLPELLEASGLEYRCLFQGQAVEDMGACAPWLVRLEPGAGLTRKLFMDERSLGLWHMAASTFVRSRFSFDELWRHFRKFTRLQDEDGKWLFFRFWDIQSLKMLQLSQSLAGARRFFAPYHSVIVPVPAENLCVLFERPERAAAGPADGQTCQEEV